MAAQRTIERIGSGFVLGLAALLIGASCHSDDDDVVTIAAAHQDVTLRDTLGRPIPVGSQEPYSPRETCGDCHWVDMIANGYHFQQGRTDEIGRILVADDYFGDGRNYVRSPGMYGKW